MLLLINKVAFLIKFKKIN